MIVPFAAFVEFLQGQRPDLTLTPNTLGFIGTNPGLLDISRTLVVNYTNGVREGRRVSVPKTDTIKEGIFKSICSPKLLNITSNNYKEIALSLITFLLNNQYIHPDFINVQDYINRIKKENPPKEREQFELFLDSCELLKFLSEYLRLWKNSEYQQATPPQARMLDAATPEYVLVSRFGDNYEKYLKQQLVSGEDNEIVLSLEKLTNNSFDFSFFQQNRLTLISGPGGQGKTSLLYALKILHAKSSKTFDDVFIVPLVNLTELSVDYISINEDFIANYILQNYGADINDISHCYLLLFDGFNELRASKNKHIVDLITESLYRLISDVSNNNNPNLSIVLTTREEKTTLNLLPMAGEGFTKTILKGTPDTLYKSIKAKFANVHYDFDDSEISELAKTPLYALMFDEFDDVKTLSRIHNKYGLFDEIYHKRAEQRLGIELQKSAYNKADYLYFYYVLLPSFAYTLNVSSNYDNTYFFFSADIESLFKSVIANDLDKILYQYNLNLFPNINGETPTLNLLSIENFLLHEESRIVEKFSIENEYAFGFEHQEWRDYLVAKHINDNVNLLKARYKQKNNRFINALHLDCNVDSNIGKMVLQSFDMYSTAEQNKAKVNDFFETENHYRISNCLFGAIKFLHVAFDFNEYLQLNLPKGKNKEIGTLHRVFSNLTGYLLRNQGNPMLVSDITGNDDILRCLTEILSKEAEYFRRKEITDKNHYQESYNIIELAKKFTWNCDIMKNQEGKLYLCLYEEGLNKSKEKLDKLLPHEMKSFSLDELFRQGMQILTSVAQNGFHLSANISGIILSNPAPVLIKNNLDLRLDCCAAFRYYMEVIYGARYINRDISYTVRQALNLLVKGYIKISDSNCFDPDDRYSAISTLVTEKCSPIFGEKINESSVRFAESLLKKAEGQDIAGMNFLRGYVAFALNKPNEAQVFWNTPLPTESTLMYNIARKFYLEEMHLDEEIESDFKNIASRIRSDGNGKIDLTHPVYWYLEAKSFLLSLAEEESLEKHRNFFAKLEKEYSIASRVESVFYFLNN